MLRISHFLDNRLKYAGKVVSFTDRPRFIPQKYNFFGFWYSFQLEADVIINYYSPFVVFWLLSKLLNSIHSR
jgi:hypothetical protein